MQQKSQVDNSKFLQWNDTITCLYLTIMLALLHYNNTLINLGQFENFYIIFLLALTEIVKYMMYLSQTRQNWRKNLIKDIAKNLGVSLVFLVVIYVSAVLMGAPVFSKIEETFSFAAIVTILAVLPACLHMGSENATTMILSLTTPEGDDINSLFMIKMRLPIFGSWLGATVIPLDWNRPWQEWSIPCYTGALVGAIIANAITSFLQVIPTKRMASKKTGKYSL